MTLTPPRAGDETAHCRAPWLLDDELLDQPKPVARNATKQPVLTAQTRLTITTEALNVCTSWLLKALSF
jgi:hypothetical protein